MMPSDEHDAIRPVTDREADPPAYDEPRIAPPGDRLTPSDVSQLPAGSRAMLRIRAEELLRRREPPSVDAWRELGPDARDLLVHLLDDAEVVRHEAMRQRVIATTAQLGVAEAMPRLGELLLDRTETPLTRTFAANALGRIDADGAMDVLGEALGADDAMVRRQIARALGAARDPRATSYLEQLLGDPAPHVAEVATAQLRKLGRGVQVERDTPDTVRAASPAPEVGD